VDVCEGCPICTRPFARTGEDAQLILFESGYAYHASCATECCRQQRRRELAMRADHYEGDAQHPPTTGYRCEFSRQPLTAEEVGALELPAWPADGDGWLVDGDDGSDDGDSEDEDDNDGRVRVFLGDLDVLTPETDDEVVAALRTALAVQEPASVYVNLVVEAANDMHGRRFDMLLQELSNLPEDANLKHIAVDVEGDASDFYTHDRQVQVERILHANSPVSVILPRYEELSASCFLHLLQTARDIHLCDVEDGLNELVQLYGWDTASFPLRTLYLYHLPELSWGTLTPKLTLLHLCEIPHWTVDRAGCDLTGLQDLTLDLFTLEASDGLAEEEEEGAFFESWRTLCRDVEFESVSFSRADEAARPLVDSLLADGVKVRVEEWVQAY
jgi:hypothetical protein